MALLIYLLALEHLSGCQGENFISFLKITKIELFFICLQICLQKYLLKIGNVSTILNSFRILKAVRLVIFQYSMIVHSR